MKVRAGTESIGWTGFARVAIIDAAAISNAQLTWLAFEVGASSADDVREWCARCRLPFSTILTSGARLAERCAGAATEADAIFARFALFLSVAFADESLWAHSGMCRTGGTKGSCVACCALLRTREVGL